MSRLVYVHPDNVANFFLNKSYEEDILITPFKLNKLLYFGYCWVLATLDERIFKERMQVWPSYGPIVMSIYRRFGDGQTTPIERGMFFTEFFAKGYPEKILKIDKKELSTKILNKVWDIYKVLTDSALFRLTQEKDSPANFPGYSFSMGTHGIVYDCAYTFDEKLKPYFEKKINEYIKDDDVKISKLRRLLSKINLWKWRVKNDQ